MYHVFGVSHIHWNISQTSLWVISADLGSDCPISATLSSAFFRPLQCWNMFGDALRALLSSCSFRKSPWKVKLEVSFKSYVHPKTCQNRTFWLLWPRIVDVAFLLLCICICICIFRPIQGWYSLPQPSGGHISCQWGQRTFPGTHHRDVMPFRGSLRPLTRSFSVHLTHFRISLCCIFQASAMLECAWRCSKIVLFVVQNPKLILESEIGGLLPELRTGKY